MPVDRRYPVPGAQPRRGLQRAIAESLCRVISSLDGGDSDELPMSAGPTTEITSIVNTQGKWTRKKPRQSSAQRTSSSFVTVGTSSSAGSGLSALVIADRSCSHRLTTTP